MSDFLARLSYAMTRSPALPRFAENFSASGRAVGFAAAIGPLAVLLFRPVARFLGPRAGLVLLAATPFACAFVRGYAALLVVLALQGIAVACCERAPGRSSWLAGLVAPVAAGFALDLVARDPLAPARREFLGIWIAAGAVGVGALLLSLRRAAPPEQPPGRRALATGVVAALVSFAGSALAVFLTLYVTDILEQGNWLAGVLLAVQAGAGGAARPLVARMRMGRRPLVVAGLALASLPLVLAWMVRAPLLIVPLMALFGVGEALVEAAVGARGGPAWAGEAAGPIVLGIVKDAFSRRTPFEHLAYLYAFAPVGVLLLATALGFALLAREPGRTMS